MRPGGPARRAEPAPAGAPEGANQPRPTAGSRAPPNPHPEPPHALTRHRAQQSPRVHWAPARSEQLWARQQASGHSWSRREGVGPDEGAATQTPGEGASGAPASAPGDRERGPDLAGAAVTLLAVLHEAVPAARPRHEDPGVRRVGKTRTAPLAEEGAQLAPAAGAEYAWERVPTGGEGRRACGDRPPQSPARLRPPPATTPCAWPHSPWMRRNRLSSRQPGSSTRGGQRGQVNCT